MPAPKPLSQNESPLSKAAARWLMAEKQHLQPHALYLLDLAHWGLENKVEDEWRRWSYRWATWREVNPPQWALRVPAG
jgi:hypothetical protein